jgi:spermidine synthase
MVVAAAPAVAWPVRRARALLLAAVFVCAACGLVYELALVALGSYLVGSSLHQTALVLSVIVSAMGLGALAAKPLSRRPVPAFAAVELTLAVVGAGSVPALYAAFAWLDLYTPALLVAAVAIGALIGAEIPLLMRLVQDVRAQDAADAVADLSAADYVGALAGGLAFPFVLLPLFGLLRGALVVGAVNVVAAWAVAGWLYRRRVERRVATAISGACLLVVGLLGGAAVVAGRFELTARQALYDAPIVHAERSAYQEIVVTQARDDLRLFLNGDLQFSSLDEYRYHEALVHPALAGAHDDVLVLGGGDGLALREVLRYDDVARVTLVDLDARVVALARRDRRLAALNDGAFADPRVTVVAADAFAWLRTHDRRYDAVVVDLPDADSVESAKLYSVEFYGLLRRVLRPDGRLTVQAGSPFFAPEAYWSVDASLRAAGWDTVPYHVDVPSFGDWGFVLAAAAPATPTLARPAPADLRFVTPDVLAAATVFPPDRDRADVEPSTLLRPVILDYARRGWRGY